MFDDHGIDDYGIDDYGIDDYGIDDYGIDDTAIDALDLPQPDLADPFAEPDLGFDPLTQAALDAAQVALTDGQAELDAALLDAGLPDSAAMPTGVDATLAMLDTVAADVNTAMTSTDIAEIDEITDDYTQRNAMLEANVEGEAHWRDVMNDIEASEAAMQAQEALTEAALVQQQAQFAIDDAARLLGDR